MTAQDRDFAVIDALWDLHEKLRVVLAAKMAARRQQFDERLRDLEQFAIFVEACCRSIAVDGRGWLSNDQVTATCSMSLAIIGNNLRQPVF